MPTIGQAPDVERIRMETEQLKEIHAQAVRELLEMEQRMQKTLRMELDEMERRKQYLRTFEEHRPRVPVAEAPMPAPGPSLWTPTEQTVPAGYGTYT